MVVFLKLLELQVDNLNNANAGVGIASTTTLKIYNYDDYLNNHQSDATFNLFRKKSWHMGLTVFKFVQIDDDFADQSNWC